MTAWNVPSPRRESVAPWKPSMLIAGTKFLTLSISSANASSIKVPFVGGKLEAQAAPALLEGFAVQQKVGDEWLATRNAESA